MTVDSSVQRQFLLKMNVNFFFDNNNKICWTFVFLRFFFFQIFFISNNKHSIDEERIAALQSFHYSKRVSAGKLVYIVVEFNWKQHSLQFTVNNGNIN